MITQGLDRILLMRVLEMGGGDGEVVDFLGANAKERKRESPDFRFPEIGISAKL